MLSAFPPPYYPLTLSQSRPLRYGLFFFLYVMQGIPSGFYLTALTNYFTAEGVRPDKVASFIAIIGLPWAFQFVWGALIDRFQGSPMGRRKPWVVGSQLMTVLASGLLLFVGDPVAELTPLAWLFCIRSVFAAIQDASVDAMAITILPEKERGRGNAFMRAGFLAGTGIGAAVFSHILRDYGFHTAALAQVAFLSTGVLLMAFIREQPGDRLLPSFGRATVGRATLGRLTVGRVTVDSINRSGQEIKSSERADHDFRWLFTELFRGLFSRQSLLIFGAILLAYMSNALFLRAYNHHLIDKLGWRDTEVSVLAGTYGMIVATVIALTGGYLADRIGARRLLLIMLGIVAVYLLGFNLFSETWVRREVAQVGLVALYFMDPAVSAAAMPVLMSICRKGVEGSQFTTYMAFVNLGDIVGTYFAGNALLYLTAPTIGLTSGVLAVVATAIAVLAVRHYRSARQ
ncbi:MFS transporter [Spirosoma utsteinense]|uniref:PAT family beta-lactamase induction signal transducer AmpG n=1 Tax=Spirosoma utsteinense TaxID=2585773 RepID=A0ABR6WCP1_9BACT|nr:MFS transporter [Spirosoma utsteinense]MBC3793750.1 PAT family beta-lactamase induction signal transducer AmpG [Spirosoma utsteinense]